MEKIIETKPIIGRYLQIKLEDKFIINDHNNKLYSFELIKNKNSANALFEALINDLKENGLSFDDALNTIITGTTFNDNFLICEIMYKNIKYFNIKIFYKVCIKHRILTLFINV